MSNYSPKHPDAGSNGAKKSGSSKATKGLVIAILAVLAVIIAAALIFIFVPGAENGISSLFGGSGYVPETQGETTIISIYYKDGVLPTSGSRHDVDVINGGGASAAELEGSWRLDQVTVYEFDGQGRGIMLTAVDNYTFLYSAENGKLAIDYDSDGGADRLYNYVINGDKLTLTLDDQKFEFTKTDTP